LPIFTEAGFNALENREIALSGLGGVGGGAFLALVRSGVTRFRLAENGIFDPPDMNRQAAAFAHTMNRPKLDVYVELARSINPDVKLRLFPAGINPANLEDFLAGTDLHIGVIDVEKGAEVKAMTPALLEKFNIPIFSCAAVGFGALLVAHKPGGMMPDQFWELVNKKSGTGSIFPAFMEDLFDRGVMKRVATGVKSGTMPTTAIGGLASNTLLATEVLTYMLRDTGLVNRQAVFAPEFTMVDFLNQTLMTIDIGI